MSIRLGVSVGIPRVNPTLDIPAVPCLAGFSKQGRLSRSRDAHAGQARPPPRQEHPTRKAGRDSCSIDVAVSGLSARAPSFGRSASAHARDPQRDSRCPSRCCSPPSRRSRRAWPAGTCSRTGRSSGHRPTTPRHSPPSATPKPATSGSRPSALPAARQERQRLLTAFRGQSRTDALALIRSQQSDFVGAPFWRRPQLQAGERIKSYLGDFAALVEPATGPNLLLESGTPLRARTASGADQPIDTTLVDHGGDPSPANAPVDARIAKDPRQGDPPRRRRDRDRSCRRRRPTPTASRCPPPMRGADRSS